MGYIARVFGKFFGLEPTKNEDWAFLKFIVPELYKGESVIPKQPNIKIIVSADDVKKFEAFKPGEEYNMEVEIEVTQPNGRYPAQLSFSLLKAALKSTNVPVYQA